MFFQRNLSFLFLRKLLAFPPHPPSSFSFSCQWTLAWSVSEHTSTMVKQPSQGAVLQELLCALELQETWVKVYVCMYIYSCVCILSRKKYLLYSCQVHWYVCRMNQKGRFLWYDGELGKVDIVRFIFALYLWK